MSIQRIRQILAPRTNARICFIHLPKCGGTSVDDALRLSYGIRARLFRRNQFRLNWRAYETVSRRTDSDKDDTRRELLRYYLAHPEMRYVGGHFRIGPNTTRDLGEGWKFLSLFRSPIERWFSQFFFFTRRPVIRDSPVFEIENYLETRRAINGGRIYVRAFTEGIPIDIASSAEAIEMAIDTINRLHLVGILEDLERFVSDFHDMFGTRLFIPKRNVGPVAPEKRGLVITDGIRERVREICTPDLKVYRAVLKRLGRSGGDVSGSPESS